MIRATIVAADCSRYFNHSICWAQAVKLAFNRYYAAPTMHQLILQTGRQPSDNNPFLTLEQEIQPRLRMIANAAGDLLPSLAIQLCDTFGANGLPAYGMTECMPISSPPSGSFGPSHASRFLRGCTNKATYQLTHSFAFGAD